VTEFAPAIVGRTRELELLDHVLEDSSAGSPQLVLVTGEPGIGKTALLMELSRRADERGCLVLQGSAAEFEAELPFGLIVDALDEYLESLDPRAFNRLATEDLAELAGVFPALRSLDKGSDVPTTAAERYRAHRAVRDLIECLAVTQPLVLVLDDLHWADAASLELTSHLLRRPPRARMVLAIAFRAGQAQAVETTIAAACRGSKTVRRVSLGPLEPADAEALVDLPDQADRERLYRASGGNPFYLLELARIHGEGRHGSSSLDDDLDVPSAVMAAIGGELDRLSAPARCMAEAGAVVGDPFDLDLAVATASLAAADGLAAMDELTSCDLVRPANVPRRFLFRHPLVRRAAYESCAAGARLAAHERCADALAAQGAPAAMRAHHVQHAARHGDLAAIAVLRDAGEASAERAPASAARWFELALRLLPESASEEERVPLLMALAAALAATGRLEDSRAALLEGLAVMTDDEQEPRLKLIGMCASLEQRLGRHEEAHTRLVTALAPLSDSRSPHAVELMIHLAHGDLYRMDFDSMREWAERARSTAQSLENFPLAAASTALLAVADASSGAVSEARAQCSQAAARVDVLSDDELAHRLDALANLCTAELYLHRYDQAAAHAKRGLAIGHATGQADLSPVLIPVLANILHMWGKISESAELLDETIEAARLSGNVEGLGWGLLGQAFTAVAAGDIELALTAAKESVELTRALDDSLVSTNAGVALAHALYESGEPRRAIDTLLTSAGGQELSLLPDGWRANYFELLTRCWIALDRLDEAQQAAAHAHSTAASVRLPLADAMSHRASAAVALYQDDSRLAADQAAAAVAAADKIGARVDAAIARTLLGRALAGAGESERAVKELELATQQLDSCGAVRYRNQAEQELRKLGRHPYRRTRPQNADGVGVDTLTRREADIARLVTNRDTNSEIAAQLVLSVKTIESHMHNIFRKLDVSSRVEVARSVERAEAVQQAQAEQRADRQRHELGE
jgi:DNA-binding NarL/FixJ family response regulator